MRTPRLPGALVLASTLLVSSVSPAFALDPTHRQVAPDTDKCPWQLTPAPPVDESEVPQPGEPTPSAWPVPEVRTGGANLQNLCGTLLAAGMQMPPGQLASSFIVFDLDSGNIIATKDPHGRYRPASVIKVLLALVALEELPLDRRYTATWDDANMEGSSAGIGPGGVYTTEQLLSGLLLVSGNDCAHALAAMLGGDAVAVQKVNALAQKLGGQDTRVANYSGLDGPGQHTSAFDLALFYRKAWKNETFARLVNTDHVMLPGWGDHPPFEIWNDNGLMMNTPTGIGGKTGYTDDAYHTFVGAQDRDGRRLAAILLNTTIDSGRPWEQARGLLDAAYATAPSATIGQVLSLAAEQAQTTATTTPAAPVNQAADAQNNKPLAGSRQTGIGAIVTGIVLIIVLAAVSMSLKRRRR